MAGTRRSPRRSGGASPKKAPKKSGRSRVKTPGRRSRTRTPGGNERKMNKAELKAYRIAKLQSALLEKFGGDKVAEKAWRSANMKKASAARKANAVARRAALGLKENQRLPIRVDYNLRRSIGSYKSCNSLDKMLARINKAKNKSARSHITRGLLKYLPASGRKFSGRHFKLLNTCRTPAQLGLLDSISRFEKRRNPQSRFGLSTSKKSKPAGTYVPVNMGIFNGVKVSGGGKGQGHYKKLAKPTRSRRSKKGKGSPKRSKRRSNKSKAKRSKRSKAPKKSMAKLKAVLKGQ